MITRHMQNAEVNVTKETYYEMCEMLGEEPTEENTPVDFADFPDLVQQCFVIYRILSDNWDTMNGNYMGKDYTIVFKLFDLYELDRGESLVAIELLQYIDMTRSKSVSEKLKAKSPATK